MLLSDLLEENLKAYGEYPFLYFHEHTYTNLDTKAYAEKIACGLRTLGIGEGDRVMVCLPNLPEVVFSYQGITRAGAVIVPVLFLLHPEEMAYIIRNSGAKAVITSSATLEKIQKAIEGMPNRPTVIIVDQPDDDAMINLYDLMDRTDFTEANPLQNLDEKDTAVILYTSGTTGKPKGVRLTHKNLCSNAISSAANNDREPGTTLGVLPLAHVYGLTVSNVCFLTGSSIVVFSKFDPEKVFAAIEQYKVRSFSAVPAMIHAMLHHPKAGDYDLSSLENVGSGSAPMPVALIEKFKQKFGADVYEGYGLSEAAPVVTAHRRDLPHKPGSVGVPIPGVEIRIVDDEDHEIPVGQVGELIVHGDNVSPGYFQNEEETRRALKKSWLHTGDLAKVDEDGYLYIVDRKKDLIIRGGFNIYPRDLEELLMRHEAVSEAAVIGVPDERMGEEVLAYVVKKQGSTVVETELVAYCQAHLAKNKTPRKVVFIESLPRNGVGKVLKTKLKDISKGINLFA
ncbi:MAG TPA: long-chain fatty acid--CoA ligase [Bacillales bacterium]|nr:long-chain fatty acid--CoA ligase [Bacillales bacterium]